MEKLKAKDIQDFKVYQLVDRKTNTRTQPALSTDPDTIPMIGGLALFNPLDVEDKYKNSYITTHWDHLDLLLIAEMIDGKIKVINKKLIELKNIGRIDKKIKETIQNDKIKK